MITGFRVTRRVLWAALALAGLGAGAAAQAADPLRVRLDITADEALRPLLQSCLTTQLDASGEVKVDSEGSIVLRLIAMEQKATTGEPLGFLLYAAGLFRTASEDENAVVVKWERLRATPPDLSVACKHVFTDFEKEVIQSVRDAQKLLQEQLGGRR